MRKHVSEWWAYHHPARPTNDVKIFVKIFVVGCDGRRTTAGQGVQIIGFAILYLIAILLTLLTAIPSLVRPEKYRIRPANHAFFCWPS
jgi:hypothetical protein